MTSGLALTLSSELIQHRLIHRWIKVENPLNLFGIPFEWHWAKVSGAL